jgi:hypothetical protein
MLSDSENEGRVFLQNVDELPFYVVSYFRRILYYSYV